MKLPNIEYELTLDGVEECLWHVHGVRVREALNAPFRAVVDASIDVELNSDDMLGADVSLRMGRETFDPQYLFGIVTRVDLLGFEDHRLHLRLHVGSAFELLRQVVHSKIWQGYSVLGILDDWLCPALADYGRVYDIGKVTRGMKVREYCVQYRESLYDLTCRLLEEEGISYTFIHDPGIGREVLKLFDENDQYEEITAIDADASEFDDDELSSVLPIIINNADDASCESIQAIEWTRALTSTSVLRRDFNWQQPSEVLTAESSGSDERGRTRRVYTHNLRRFQAADLEERANDASAANALLGALCSGRGNASVLRPGMIFTLSGHSREDLEQEYVVISIRHRGQPKGGSSYRNEFECVPLKVEIRPPQVTSKPQVRGLHTAIVTGDEEIYTDQFGRIKVQFSWEESPSYASDSSCWIRCAQTWAGEGWGAQFIPRVGMEVLVEFVEGNPDRPLVTGCVYHSSGSQGSPFLLPDKKSQSGWRTRSSPDSEGFNELRFEDAAGSEEIFVHAERNLRSVVKAEESRCVGASRSTSIGDCDELTVKKDLTITLEEGSRTTTISQGDDELTVTKGGASRSVPSGTDSLSAKTVTVDGSTSITLTCGSSSIEMTPGDVTIKSPMIKLNP